MSPFENLGKALRWLRQHRGLRQCDVAYAALVTRPMLSAYENERRQPSLETLGRLLVALHADLADLQEALDRQRGALGAPPHEGERPGWKGGVH